LYVTIQRAKGREGFVFLSFVLGFPAKIDLKQGEELKGQPSIQKTLNFFMKEREAPL
jgi:hypothetical protein